MLDVFTYQPVILGYEIPEEQLELYRSYMSQLFQKLVKCKRFTQIRVPTEANAAESGLDPQEYIRRMTNAYDIDYKAVHESCVNEMRKISSANRVAVYTGTARGKPCCM